MSRTFEEPDYRETPIGALSVRRRRELSLDVDVFEIKLGDEFLMSSLFTASEVALADLDGRGPDAAARATPGRDAGAPSRRASTWRIPGTQYLPDRPRDSRPRLGGQFRTRQLGIVSPEFRGVSPELAYQARLGRGGVLAPSR